MAEEKLVSMEEVSKHNKETDVWMAIRGVVYNVTDFLEDHPGGPDIMMEYAGCDGTIAFDDVSHSQSALDMLPQYKVGVVEGYVPPTASERAAGEGNILMYIVPLLLLVLVAAYKMEMF